MKLEERRTRSGDMGTQGFKAAERQLGNMRRGVKVVKEKEKDYRPMSEQLMNRY